MIKKLISCSITLILVIIVLGLGLNLIVFAGEAFPEKPITLVAPFGFGGGWDLFGRSLALGSRTKEVKINVINISGGGGINAMNYVNNEPADGYTILGMEGSQTIGTATGKTTLSLTEDFIPLMKCVETPMGIFTKADSPYKNLKDLIDAVKADPEGIIVGGSDAGGLFNVATIQIFENAGTKVKYLPHAGEASRTLTSILGGHIDAVFGVISVFGPLIESGDIRPLVFTTPKRLEEYPDIPTLKELGYDYGVPAHWRGLAVKKGTPTEIVETLKDVFKNGLDSKIFLTIAEQGKMEIIIIENEELVNFIKIQEQTFKKILGK